MRKVWLGERAKKRLSKIQIVGRIITEREGELTGSCVLLWEKEVIGKPGGNARKLDFSAGEMLTFSGSWL